MSLVVLSLLLNPEWLIKNVAFSFLLNQNLGLKHSSINVWTLNEFRSYQLFVFVFATKTVLVTQFKNIFEYNLWDQFKRSKNKTKI